MPTIYKALYQLLSQHYFLQFLCGTCSAQSGVSPSLSHGVFAWSFSARLLLMHCIFPFHPFFKFKDTYVFIHERERHRQRHRLPAMILMWGWILGPGSCPEPKVGAQPLNHPDAPPLSTLSLFSFSLPIGGMCFSVFKKYSFNPCSTCVFRYICPLKKYTAKSVRHHSRCWKYSQGQNNF